MENYYKQRDEREERERESLRLEEQMKQSVATAEDQIEVQPTPRFGS